jgi:hypothetical protein
VDSSLVGATVNRCSCADHANPAIACRSHGGLRAGNNDADNGNLQGLLQPGHRKRGSGVARDDNNFRLFSEQQTADFHAIALNGRRAFAPVRNARGVANVKNILRRQQFAKRCRDRQSADARVEDADGGDFGSRTAKV